MLREPRIPGRLSITEYRKLLVDGGGLSPAKFGEIQAHRYNTNKTKKGSKKRWDV